VIVGTQASFSIQTRDRCDNRCIEGDEPQRFAVLVHGFLHRGRPWV
jgi:hypothetical protein